MDALAQYAEDAKPTTISSNSLTVLNALAEEQAAAENAVTDAELALAKAKETLKDIAERRLPEAMTEIGMADFKTTSGLQVEIEEGLRCGISEERAPKAFAWLRANNHAALIKRVIKREFGVGEDKKAEAALKKLGQGAEDKASVHSSTLKSFLKEQLKKGTNIPLELFGIHQFKVAKITRPGEDKKSRKGRKDEGVAPF